jgi:hypothetical protein
MKLIELDRKPAEKDSLQKALIQIGNFFAFSKTGEHAEDAIIARFTRGLDNRFIMLRNLPQEGLADRIPAILIGPPGLILLNMSPVQGYFRAKEETWWEMSKSTHRFNPGRPNLIKQSQEYAQKLAAILDKRQRAHPEIVPVLVFLNPGVHVETSNPAMRIVLIDGVENLIGSIVNSEEVLTANEIDYLADTLEIIGNPEKAIPMGEGEDFFGRDLLAPEKKATFSLPKIKLPTSQSLSSMENKINLSPHQWLIIEILMILVILVLVGAIIYVLVAY